MWNERGKEGTGSKRSKQRQHKWSWSKRKTEKEEKKISKRAGREGTTEAGGCF